MPSPAARERLQPSLFDRLEDDLGPATERFASLSNVLGRRLDPLCLAALQTLLADERLTASPPSEKQLAPFAHLDADLRAILDEAIRLERYRRSEQQRVFTISNTRLHAACLRDLECLFATVNVEAGGNVATLRGTPTVRASVLNYGLPGLAGTMRTPDHIAVLAHEIFLALERFEPRIRNLRVTHEGDPGGRSDERIGFLIEGELWGYPYDERLHVRTLLDADLGRLTLLTGPEGTDR